MLFNVIQRYSMLYQNICGFLWQFQLFLVPLYRQTCLTNKTNYQWPIIHVQWEERSLPPATSPTFNHKPLGRNSVDYSLKILTWHPSHSWNAARFFRQKSILFTNISGSLELPFSVLLRPWDFPALKLGLSCDESETFLPWNSGFHFCIVWRWYRRCIL